MDASPGWLRSFLEPLTEKRAGEGRAGPSTLGASVEANAGAEKGEESEFNEGVRLPKDESGGYYKFRYESHLVEGPELLHVHGGYRAFGPSASGSASQPSDPR